MILKITVNLYACIRHLMNQHFYVLSHPGFARIGKGGIATPTHTWRMQSETTASRPAIAPSPPPGTTRTCTHRTPTQHKKAHKKRQKASRDQASRDHENSQGPILQANRRSRQLGATSAAAAEDCEAEESPLGASG
jgi:hypothetical protein